jgi:hypothetical protein
MKSLPWMLSLCLFAGCAAAPTVGRAPQVPQLDLDVPQADLTRDEGMRAAADRRPAMPRVEEQASGATGGGAVAYRTFTQTVEVPVEVPVERQVTVPAEPVYVDRRGYRDYYDYDRSRRRGAWFPVNTVVGASIGAAVGRNHRQRIRGAVIGAHAGLLLDLARWW